MIADGACIASRVTDKSAFDLTNSDGFYIRRLVVHGDPNARPAVGIFVCRTSNTSDDQAFIRCNTKGEFTWAGFHNSGGENVYLEQSIFRNDYDGACYGMAQDSKTFLRYDPPVTASAVFTGNPMQFTKTAHGLNNGNRIYTPDLKDSGGNILSGSKRRWLITRVDNDRLTIPFNGANYASGGKYFKARYYSDPLVIPDADDTIEPYVGEGAFTVIVNGGQANAPYGKAGLLDTPGGRRRYNMRVTSSVYDIANSNRTISSVTGSSDTINTSGNHDLVTGEIIFVNSGNNVGLFEVVFVDSDTITVTHIDGSPATTSDSTGGTLWKQNVSGGYGIHFVGDKWESPKYENIHHETGPGGTDLRGCKSLGYIQNVNVLKDGGAAQEVSFKGIRLAEHNINAKFGGFEVDTATVSLVRWSGDLVITDFTNDFGDGLKTGKLFLSPTLWKVRGNLILAQGDTTLSGSVDFQGNLINPDTSTLDYRGVQGTFAPTLTFATTGNLSVAYSTQVGRYSKVGKRVFYEITLVTSTFTHTTASGNLRIEGLPFTVANVTNHDPAGACSMQGWTKANYGNIAAHAISNTTRLQIQVSGSAQNVATLGISEMPTGGSVILRCAGSYEATS